MFGITRRFSTFQVGTITVAGPLDRETESQYQIFVVARDGAQGGSQLEVYLRQSKVQFHNFSHIIFNFISIQTTATVRITVTDINDNVPQFGSSSYRARFQEDIALGTEVLPVSWMEIHR